MDGPQSAARVYSEMSVESGQGIKKDMVFDEQENHLFVMTDDQVWFQNDKSCKYQYVLVLVWK